MSLPDALQAAVTAWLAGRGGAGARRQGSEALSATYRAGGSSSAIDLGAYLVARLPATFAAVSRVLAEVAARRPGFMPASVLDAGSGPGTASWAALEQWPSLVTATFLDNSPAFLKLAGQLAGHGPAPLRAAAAIAGTLNAVPEPCAADLVIAAYALAELPKVQVASAARSLWSASRSVLVIVEPGTPEGFARIRLARDCLLAAGAIPVAPCPHALACPVSGNDWCHFSVRLPRSRAHMHAKRASVPFEDERFAYLAVARDGQQSGGARIVAPPRKAKSGMTLQLCTQGRLEPHHVARRDSEAYKSFRKSEWGDLVPPTVEEETSP